MTNKETYVLPDQEALFFYKTVLSSIANTSSIGKNLISIAKRHGITVIFIEDDKCKKQDPDKDIIVLYEEKKKASKQLINHVRNAYAHLYIKIGNGRCQMMDWNPFAYDEKTKKFVKARFSKDRVTMLGDVSFQSLKDSLEEYFSSSKEYSEDTTN